MSFSLSTGALTHVERQAFVRSVRKATGDNQIESALQAAIKAFPHDAALSLGVSGHLNADGTGNLSIYVSASRPMPQPLDPPPTSIGVDEPQLGSGPGEANVQSEGPTLGASAGEAVSGADPITG